MTRGRAVSHRARRAPGPAETHRSPKLSDPSEKVIK